MLYRFLTDLTVVVHFSFLAFVLLGGLAARRRRWLVVPHLVAAAWGVYALAQWCLAGAVVCVNACVYLWPRTRSGERRVGRQESAASSAPGHH
jgi:hypothetical protein